MRNIFLLAFFIFSLQLQAQDWVFSQFYASPLNINPAFVGSTYAPRIGINYRNQLTTFPQAFTTFSVSYDQYLEKLKSGFGLMLASDNAGQGLYRKNLASMFYSYQLDINRDYKIKFGLEAGLLNSTIGWDKLIFLDQLDPVNGVVNPTEESQPENLSRFNLDISAGLLFVGSKYYAGLSVKHLNTPDESILNINAKLNNGLPYRITFQGGLEIPIVESNKKDERSFISPNILLAKQGDFTQLNVGAYAKMGVIFAGAWYRQAGKTPDAAIMLVGFQKGVAKIGYSYDYNLSVLNRLGGGSHELSIILNFDELFDRRVDYNDCLNLFR